MGPSIEVALLLQELILDIARSRQDVAQIPQ
jgi:hypothetical protein